MENEERELDCQNYSIHFIPFVCLVPLLHLYYPMHNKVKIQYCMLFTFITRQKSFNFLIILLNIIHYFLTYIKDLRQTSLRILIWKEIPHIHDNLTEYKKKDFSNLGKTLLYKVSQIYNIFAINLTQLQSEIWSVIFNK